MFHPVAGHTDPEENRSIAVLFHDLRTRCVWVFNVMSRPPLPTGKSRCPLKRRLGGPQGRSGEVRKISPHRDRSPDHRARSEYLYQLSYPGNLRLWSSFNFLAILSDCTQILFSLKFVEWHSSCSTRTDRNDEENTRISQSCLIAL